MVYKFKNMRYHNSIDFVSDIPDELTEYQIPKLTLQPIIENAILHGILEKSSNPELLFLPDGWKMKILFFLSQMTVLVSHLICLKTLFQGR